MDNREIATTWLAPAKINLFLHITAKREDGYHELQTVFQFIDLCDQLSFSLRKDRQIRRHTEVAGVPADNDLTVRAAKILQKAGNIDAGVDISIDKIIPMGGGLGGGSSNAATTLVALNQLWGLNLPQSRLESLGLEIGADVPVFIRGHSAWAEGVGEKLESISLGQPWDNAWYVILSPNCHVSTAEIFSDRELTRDSHPIKIDAFRSGQTENVCESVVRRRYPEVGMAIDWLSAFAPTRMSGTGASVFAPFAEKHQADAVIEQLPPNWRGFVVKGLSESPLINHQ
ncbi:MAG: 4-(cytidine 5'-diphospho)-2-C-methyl-D-erythritol kinase [Gammaproteobacteria bacterium]